MVPSVPVMVGVFTLLIDEREEGTTKDEQAAGPWEETGPEGSAYPNGASWTALESAPEPRLADLAPPPLAPVLTGPDTVRSCVTGRTRFTSAGLLQRVRRHGGRTRSHVRTT